MAASFEDRRRLGRWDRPDAAAVGRSDKVSVRVQER